MCLNALRRQHDACLWFMYIHFSLIHTRTHTACSITHLLRDLMRVEDSRDRHLQLVFLLLGLAQWRLTFLKEQICSVLTCKLLEWRKTLTEGQDRMRELVRANISQLPITARVSAIKLYSPHTQTIFHTLSHTFTLCHLFIHSLLQWRLMSRWIWQDVMKLTTFIHFFLT